MTAVTPSTHSANSPMTDVQTYERRVARLAESRRRDTIARRAAVTTAIRELQREDRPVTRRAVIARAGVHRNFLHRHKDLANQIDQISTEQRNRPPPTSADRISHASLLTDLTTARHRIRELQQQVQTLEHRLGEFGPAPTAALLEHHPLVIELRERLAQSEITCSDKDRTITSLRDDIEVLRETNRSLVREYGLHTTES